MSRQGTYLGKADLSISGRKIGSISRREALCAGASTVLWTMIAGLAGGAKPARAEALGGQVPTVDRLSVRVVTDSYYLAFAQNQKVGDMEVQRFRIPPSDQPPGRALLSEFGLAWHVESMRGGETRIIMLDFGFTGDTLNNNLDLYGIAPEKIDAMMLTHGHYDHFGGMVGFLTKHKSKLKVDIPFYVGGEEAFCTRQQLVGPQPSNFGALDRRAIEDAKVKVLFADQPSLIADHGFATGPLPAVRESLKKHLYGHLIYLIFYRSRELSLESGVDAVLAGLLPWSSGFLPWTGLLRTHYSCSASRRPRTRNRLARANRAYICARFLAMPL